MILNGRRRQIDGGVAGKEVLMIRIYGREISRFLFACGSILDMRGKTIFFNWKMKPETAGEARRIMKAVLAASRKRITGEIIVASPFVYIAEMARMAKGSGVKIAGQNCFIQAAGAFTGEISPTMLKDAGAEYVIIGHSERRAMGEDDGLINRKVKAAISAGLKVILAVGEAKKKGVAEAVRVAGKQVSRGLVGVVKEDYKKVILAYEPVWAISTSRGVKQAEPEYVGKVMALLNKWGMPVLYGGSVGAENISDFLSLDAADGVLVGGASLKVEALQKIINSL